MRQVHKARIAEVIALLMIGDGAVSLIRPTSHVLLWDGGPPAWRGLIRVLAQRPGLTRALAAAEIMAGVCLALRQLPYTEEPLEIRTGKGDVEP